MKIKVKYFGLVAEKVGFEEQILEISTGLSASKFKEQQIAKYQIEDAESIQMAVNQNLTSNSNLNEGDEVAFLPPFAGG